MKTILTIATFLLASLHSEAYAQDSPAGTSAAASGEATRTLLMHHLSSFQDNDLEAVMSDYTSESVLITQEATYIGPEEIRGFFAGLIPQFPRHRSTFALDKMVVSDGVVFIVWHAKTPTLDVPLGSDTFLVKAGKIHRQTFVGQLRHTAQ